MRAPLRPHPRHRPAPGVHARIMAVMALVLLVGCSVADGPEPPSLLSAREIAALEAPGAPPVMPVARRPAAVAPTAIVPTSASPQAADIDARAVSLRARAEAMRQQDAAQRDAASALRARAEAMRRVPTDCADDPDCAAATTESPGMATD